MDEQRTLPDGGRSVGETPTGQAGLPAAGSAPVPPQHQAVDTDGGLRRRQLGHDINHQIGTVSLLATLLADAVDIGPDSRARARLILREIERLDQLQRAYNASTYVGEAGPSVADRASVAPADGDSYEPVRLDLVAAEVIETIAPVTRARVEIQSTEVTAHTDRLAYWRVLRNVVQNAVRAAGPTGTVRVRIAVEGRWAVTRVDDDGPGLTAEPDRPGGLGLDIVRDLTTGWGGRLEIRPGNPGGCSVLLRTPLPRPAGAAGVPATVDLETAVR